jgi:deazaflavin-dependent oxidoreductase (nitroreductase family)
VERVAVKVGRAVVRGLGALKRAMYRGGRPNAPMRLVNRFDALTYGSRLLAPRSTAVLRVVGRRSGELMSVPVAVAEHAGAEYLVSMLGPHANWVRNVEAAHGAATLFRAGREIPIVLEEVPPGERAEILRNYLAVAPGARPHLGLTPTASLAEFRAIAPRHPAYRIVPVSPAR